MRGAGQGKGAIGVPAPASVPEFLVKVIGDKHGLDLVAAPYRGSAPMITDLLGRQIAAGVGSIPDFIENHRAGRLKVVAVLGGRRQAAMPEVATSIAAAIKGERDIAVGNVIGSSTFNIFGCLGLSGVLAGSAGLVVPGPVLAFDLWVMLAVALACLPIFLTGREIARWEGAVFLAYYVAYVAYLILAAQSHDALPAFSGVMMSFVLPLTVITLVVVLIRRPAGTPAH